MKSKEDFINLFELTIFKIVKHNNVEESEFEVKNSFYDLTTFEDINGLSESIRTFLMIIQSFDFKLHEEIFNFFENSAVFREEFKFDLDEIPDNIYDELNKISNAIDYK